MDAKEFAEEFANCILEDLKKVKKPQYIFSYNVYKNDPELKVLTETIKPLGYTLILSQPNEEITKQEWSLIKI